MKLLLVLICLATTTCRAQDSTVIPLWPNGAPGFEQLKGIPEQAKDWWVRDINNPTLTVFAPPAGHANGTAIVLCPGGGFLNIVFNSEGRNPAKFLDSLGITVFVLKYRLFRMANSPYTQENPTQDIFRAMRLVKSLAGEYHLDTAKIGVMGFSAGGEVAGWVSYRFRESHVATSASSYPARAAASPSASPAASHPPAHDPIDDLSARPGFQVLIYPGPLCVPDAVPADAPPTFLCAANGDECCSEPTIRLVELHRKAKVPVELHLYEKGAHAFSMGYGSPYIELQHWRERLVDWMKDNGLVN